jgi:hypothetical protein
LAERVVKACGFSEPGHFVFSVTTCIDRAQGEAIGLVH